MVDTDAGELRQRAPVLYQGADDERTTVPGRFMLDGTSVRFSVGPYDTTRTLVIDPVLSYSTYLGGRTAPHAEDMAFGIAVDNKGAAYVTGQACTASFPKTTYAYQKTRKGDCDAFVTKFKPTQGTGVGTGLVYSTFLGGSGTDRANDIALDNAKNAYVVGTTGSSDFPTTVGAYQQSGGGGFITKLNAAGKALLYSTRYTGGSDHLTLGPGMPATPGKPTVYVAGGRSGPTPTADAFQSTCRLSPNGTCEDLWLAKFNPGGGGAADLVYATYIGGSETDADYTDTLVTVDSAGRAHVSAATQSIDFPMPESSFDNDPAPLEPYHQGIVAVLDPSQPSDGTGIPSPANQQLPWASYFVDFVGTAIAIGPGDTLYLAGHAGERYKTTEGAFDRSFECSAPGCNAGLMKFDLSLPSDGSADITATNQQLVYSTYIGGGKSDYLLDLTVDAAGRAWMAGYTSSSNYPLKNPIQATCQCFIQATYVDGVVSGIAPATGGSSDLIFSTFLGGRLHDLFHGIARDTAGNLYVAGRSDSYKNSHGNCKADRYPVVANNFQMNNPGGAYEDPNSDCNLGGNGCGDAVVSKISGV